MLKQTRGLFVSLAMLALATGPAFAQTVVTVGTVAEVDPGASVSVPVDITGATAAAGVNWKITYDAGSVSGDVTAADGTGLGNHTLTSNALAGDNRGVVYRTDVTEAFLADGQLATLAVNVPGTAGNGDVIALTVDTNYADDGIASAISDTAGATLGSFVSGQISVSTPYPVATTDFTADWTPSNGFNAPPYSFNLVTATFDGSNQPAITNSNAGNDAVSDGFRAYGNWESRDDLVPFYDSNSLVMMEYDVVGNKADAVPGADTRFRATLLAADPNTLATLPEYHVYTAQPRSTGVDPDHTLPTTTPRKYRFFWSTDDVAPTRNYKKMGWDIIAFAPGLPTDLTYTMTDFNAVRYDLAKVEAASTPITEDVDFSLFNAAPDDLGTGNLFPPGSSDPGAFATFNSPGKAINNAGAPATQEMVFSWPGGATRPGNDEVVSYFDTGAFEGGVLTSAYKDVNVAADTLYIVDFYVEAVGAGMTDRANQPGHRYRINLWATGESWTVTTLSHGSSVSTAAAGDAEMTKVTVYVMSNGNLSGSDPLNLSYDANNFISSDGSSTNAGDYKLRRIRVRAVADFFNAAASGGWVLD